MNYSIMPAMAARKKTQWFTEEFGLNIPQYELPFVDFNTTRDVPLYIDPYAITKEPSELADKCHNAIVSYFQSLIDAIRNGDKNAVKKLISGHLAEPTQIHFGTSKKVGGGRGIGPEQEKSIIDALTQSSAAKTGLISSIQELELHVEGIGPDKISDLVANIILSHLASYTEEMCSTYGISTRECTVDGYWNDEQEEWDQGYFNLPVIGTDSFIIVPKRFVRKQKDLMNHRAFYEKYVLTVLQQKLLSANDSLVQTLRSGIVKVTKEAIKKDPRFVISKKLITTFIEENPNSIRKYKEDIRDHTQPTDPSFLSKKFEKDDIEIEELVKQLALLKPGTADANAYHNTVKKIIEFIFDWALTNFAVEYEMDGGRSRIDILADNNATDGFFVILREKYIARTVPMECKNYTDDLGNDEFNQIAERMGEKTSNFGILFCRMINKKEDMRKHQTSRLLRQGKAILLVEDEALKKLVQMRLQRDFKGLGKWISSQLRDIEYGHPF